MPSDDVRRRLGYLSIGTKPPFDYAGVPNGMETVQAAPDAAMRLPSRSILEQHVKRLMNVANPMAQVNNAGIGHALNLPLMDLYAGVVRNVCRVEVWAIERTRSRESLLPTWWPELRLVTIRS